MEARQTLRGGGVRKGLIVLATCAVVGAVMAGSAITKDLTGSVSTLKSSGAAQGSVLRQNNPANAGSSLLDRNAERQAIAPAAAHVGRSSGNQSVEDSNAALLPGAVQVSGAGQPGVISCEFIDKHKAC